MGRLLRLLLGVAAVVGPIRGEGTLAHGLTARQQLTECSVYECKWKEGCDCRTGAARIWLWYAVYFGNNSLTEKINETEILGIKQFHDCKATEVLQPNRAIWLRECLSPPLRVEWRGGHLRRFKPRLSLYGGTELECYEYKKQQQCIGYIYEDKWCQLADCRIDDWTEEEERILKYNHRRVIQTEQFRGIVNEYACISVECYENFSHPPFYPVSAQVERFNANCVCGGSDKKGFLLVVESFMHNQHLQLCNWLREELSCGKCTPYLDYSEVQCMSAPDDLIYTTLVKHNATDLRIRTRPRDIELVFEMNMREDYTWKLCLDNKVDVCYTEPLPITCKMLSQDLNCVGYGLSRYYCHLHQCTSLDWETAVNTPMPTGWSSTKGMRTQKYTTYNKKYKK